jgi:uncharacterized membrane protein YhaH (DUF805 family)
MWLFSLLFRFAGRIGRARFWIGNVVSLLFLIFALIVLGAVLASTKPGELQDLLGGIWASATGLAYVWMFLAICTKRFHDHESDGLWCLIFLVPAVGVLFFLIELGMVRGTRGANRYGADPLA